MVLANTLTGGTVCACKVKLAEPAGISFLLLLRKPAGILLTCLQCILFLDFFKGKKDMDKK